MTLKGIQSINQSINQSCYFRQHRLPVYAKKRTQTRTQKLMIKKQKKQKPINTSLQEIQKLPLVGEIKMHNMVRTLEKAVLKCHTSIVHNSGKTRQSSFSQHHSVAR